MLQVLITSKNVWPTNLKFIKIKNHFVHAPGQSYPYLILRIQNHHIKLWHHWSLINSVKHPIAENARIILIVIFRKIQCVERTQYRSGYLYVFHPSLIPYRHEISDRIVQHTSLITNSRAELKVTFKMNKMFYSSPFLYTYDVFALVLLIWSGYPCLFPCWVRVEVSQLTTIVILKTICNSGSAKSDFIQKSWLKNFGKFTFSYLLFCRKWAGVIFYWFLVWQHKWKTGVCKQFF